MGKAEVTMRLIKELLSDAFWESDSNLVLAADSQADEIHSLESWLRDGAEMKAHVFFQTSGSSGSPKWVAISKEALLASARAVIGHTNLKKSCKSLLTIPIYHVGGFGVIARSYLSGGSVHLCRGKWSAESFISQIEELQAQCASLVPAQVVDLVSLGSTAPSCIETIVVGGGHLNDEIYQKAIELGWPLLRSYGMSEASSQIATGDSGDYWLKILKGWDTSIDDDGRLRIKGEPLFSGYVVREHEGYSFQSPVDSEGWFTTQDEVLLQGGRLKFLRRFGRGVKILGELVDLQVVEDNLCELLGKEIIVVPIPDQRRGLVLVAVSEDSASRLPDHANRGLCAIKELLVMSEFPRSPLGKIRRADVEEWVKGRFAGDKTTE
ncbi:O-succinylbenzoic acid--CoA ligase [Rubritalea squalenifaciens DSM 18772]|uniref:O-succinylbenzoic acid--CoA ligase n=2 Tax=Rubritalea squalenifaciens TaxID=407226 RepID=A0A1M6IHJ0_9BACT|nr:O-succinylbenzoic acid--CoA ligase [Rubritalea squalenifaciens DSM 18772]